MKPKLEVRIVFCRFGVGLESNLVERPIFMSIEDAVCHLKGKLEVRV